MVWLQQFYNRFNSIRERNNIQQRDIWNMDDHGIAQRVCTNRTLPSFIKLIPPNLSIKHLQALIKKGF
jgi:hypothetical protein